jgi:hypothetical protein
MFHSPWVGFRQILDASYPVIPPIFVALAPCDHLDTPIPEVAAIVSEGTGISQAASIIPTGFIARV